MPQKRMFCRRHIKLNLPLYVVEKKIFIQLVLTLLAGIINVIPPSSFNT